MAVPSDSSAIGVAGRRAVALSRLRTRSPSPSPSTIRQSSIPGQSGKAASATSRLACEVISTFDWLLFRM